METRWRGLQRKIPFAGCAFTQACGVVTAADINLGFMIFAMPPRYIGWFRGIARGRM
jgi:hypothetical protein